MELQETARLRDRKKEWERDRERYRERFSRNKRRRGDRLMLAGNREDGPEESSDESVNDDEEDDYEVDGGGGGISRMLPPNPASTSSPSLQSTFSGLGKDFGSMNMDELLKSIWSAEETRNVSLIGVGGGEGSSAPNVGLQKQGSLTLPRTISQKKVDDVWRDLFVENVAHKDGMGCESMRSLERRQQTLGEITLEEFLFRAGVVREEDPKPSWSDHNLTCP